MEFHYSQNHSIRVYESIDLFWKWIVFDSNMWNHNCTQTNDYYWIWISMLYRNTWNHLTVCKLCVKNSLVWFNGISIFVGYLMLNPSLKKNSSGTWGIPHGLMIKVRNCGLKVKKLKLQSWYQIHSWTNILGKDINCLISLAIE